MSSLHIRSLSEGPASIWTLNATEVRDRTASLSPTPGGGSISVFTAALGLALVQKGVGVSLKRAGENVSRRETLAGLGEEIESTLATISGFADEDSEAFRNFLKARSLPQSSEEERAFRAASMESALLWAIRVPLASAKGICAGLKQAETALKLADHHLLSDVFGGAILLQASAKAILLCVVANVSMLADEAVGVALEAERVELEQISVDLGEAVARAYEARNRDIPAKNA